MLWLAAYLTGSTCRIARPSLDARSGTNVVGLIPHFYQHWHRRTVENKIMCQCPLGLIPHFYSRANGRTRLPSMLACQCPLGLIPHFYKILSLKDLWKKIRVNALSGLYLISTFASKSTLNGRSFLVSMPSRAYTSFLRYPFKNLGFMRFPEPVFAGIYQNILTTAVFRAC